uniref:PTM/DIR17-like Tudor domain-containing protein n=1 Tax=Kalanchoe fedtschenkoi TaxID=63787 RepID=A0A7N0VD90_KALFE
MENSYWEHHPEALPAGVFDLPGEPAIVINGVPDLISKEGTTAPADVSTVQEPPRDPGFGKWLEGREVRKLFNGVVYSGVLTKFDKETGWYRVEYEDGDAEDLSWAELEPVLQPLDVSIPLKTLALKVLKRSHKAPLLQKTGKVGRPRKLQASTELVVFKNPPK